MHLGDGILVAQGQVALTTVETILMNSHKDTGSTGLRGTLLSQSVNLSTLINPVELENSHLNLLAFMGDLLGGGVHLLLLLFGTTAEAKYQVESGFLLDVVIPEGAAVFQLFARKDQTLLVGWDA